MKIFAIDPGPAESAYCMIDGDDISCNKVGNTWLINAMTASQLEGHALVVEQIRSYGMSVGAEVFDTCEWSGRFIERYLSCTGIRGEVVKIPRIEVKSHLCHSAKAKDSNIRQAIIDRFGGKEKAIGKKKNPGPLYGVKDDMWAALAVGLTYLDRARKDGAK